MKLVSFESYGEDMIRKIPRCSIQPSLFSTTEFITLRVPKVIISVQLQRVTDSHAHWTQKHIDQVQLKVSATYKP